MVAVSEAAAAEAAAGSRGDERGGRADQGCHGSRLQVPLLPIERSPGP